MVHSIPDTTIATLSLVQGPRDRASASKPGLEESQTQDRRTVSRVNSESGSVTQEVNLSDLEKIVAQVQESLKPVESRIQLSVDQDLNRVVVKVVDSDSGELIRQLPPEDVLQVQRFLNEQSGLILEEEA